MLGTVRGRPDGTPEAYAQSVRQVRLFLEGKHAALAEVNCGAASKEAADAMRFEEAGGLQAIF